MRPSSRLIRVERCSVSTDRSVCRQGTVRFRPVPCVYPAGAHHGVCRRTRLASVQGRPFPGTLEAAHLYGLNLGWRMLSRVEVGFQPDPGPGQVQKTQETMGVFVIAGGHTAPLFEPAEAPFDGVTRLVPFRVVRLGVRAPLPGRNDGLGAPLRPPRAEVVAILGRVELRDSGADCTPNPCQIPHWSTWQKRQKRLRNRKTSKFPLWQSIPKCTM